MDDVYIYNGMSIDFKTLDFLTIFWYLPGLLIHWKSSTQYWILDIVVLSINKILMSMYFRSRLGKSPLWDEVTEFLVLPL